MSRCPAWRAPWTLARMAAAARPAARAARTGPRPFPSGCARPCHPLCGRACGWRGLVRGGIGRGAGGLSGWAIRGCACQPPACQALASAWWCSAGGGRCRGLPCAASSRVVRPAAAQRGLAPGRVLLLPAVSSARQPPPRPAGGASPKPSRPRQAVWGWRSGAWSLGRTAPGRAGPQAREPPIGTSSPGSSAVCEPANMPLAPSPRAALFPRTAPPLAPSPRGPWYDARFLRWRGARPRLGSPPPSRAAADSLPALLLAVCRRW